MFKHNLGPGQTMVAAALLRYTENDERGNVYVVMIDLGDELVVSEMFEKDGAWLQGHYFDLTDLDRARALFAQIMAR